MVIPRSDAHTSIQPKRRDLAEYLSDEKWLAQLSCCLADIFSEINKLNKTMQGATKNSIAQHE